MDRITVEYFLNKHVKLEKISSNFPDERPFKLYGDIKNVTDEAVLLETDQGIGAILLCDITRIVEWVDKEGKDGKK